MKLVTCEVRTSSLPMRFLGGSVSEQLIVDLALRTTPWRQPKRRPRICRAT